MDYDALENIHKELRELDADEKAEVLSDLEAVRVKAQGKVQEKKLKSNGGL